MVQWQGQLGPFLHSPYGLTPFFSLAATITKRRPELLPNFRFEAGVTPIPEEIPQYFLDQQKKDNITGIGEPIKACFLTKSNTDPTNW